MLQTPIRWKEEKTRVLDSRSHKASVSGGTGSGVQSASVRVCLSCGGLGTVLATATAQ